MYWKDLKEQMAREKRTAQKPRKAPESGYMLAYTRTNVIFQAYSSLDILDDLFQEELLELHLFDQEKEYRAIASSSKRSIAERELKAIIHVADFSGQEADQVYLEKIKLEPSAVKAEHGIAKDSITVLNHIFYDELGMARVDDYRLVIAD